MTIRQKKNPVNTVSSNKQVSSHAKRNSTPSLNLKSPSETLKANEERVRAAVEELNKELVKLQSELGFSVDKVANDVVVTVKRKESGEVVRQIPSEAALKLSQNLKDLKGILLDEKFWKKCCIKISYVVNLYQMLF